MPNPRTKPLSLAVGIALCLAADAHAVGHATLGMRLGLNRNQLRAEETGRDLEIEKMATTGIAAGLVGNVALTDWLSFQLELLYCEKGGKYDVRVGLPVEIPGFGINTIDERSLQYVEVPFLVKAVLPVRWPVRPTFVGGISAALKLDGDLKNRVNIRIETFEISHLRIEDITSQLTTLDASAVIGGGLEFAVGKRPFVLDQRFSFGLRANHYETSIPASYFQEIGIPVTEDIVYKIDMYNYVWSLSLGYLF